jgi:hypothetical protein
MMNWRGHGRKRRDLFEVLSRDFYEGTEKTKKTSVRIAGVPTEI